MKIYKIVVTDGISSYDKYIPALNMDFAFSTAKEVLSEFKRQMDEALREICEIERIEEICELENLVKLIVPEFKKGKEE